VVREIFVNRRPNRDPGSRRRRSLIYTGSCRHGLSEGHIATTPHDIHEFRIAALSQSRRRKIVCGLAVDGHDRLLAPSAVADLDLAQGEVMAQKLSAGLAVLLIVAYGLALLFPLKTHKELFASADHGDKHEAPWPLGLAVGTLLVVTVLVPLVSEIFVGSVQKAGEALGMSPAFVGFIIVCPRRCRGGDGRGIFRRAQGPPRYECQHRTWECLRYSCSSATLSVRNQWTCSSGRAR
jgi:hypothetical protein